MKNQHLRTAILFLSTLVLGTACSSIKISKPKYHQVTLQNDVWVKEKDQSPVQKSVGDKIELKDSPLLVESEGHVGVVLVPMSENSAKFDLKLQPIIAWGGKRIEDHANKVVSSVLAETFQAQALLGKGNAREALSIIKDLENKHPKISYLKFVKASCFVVLGNNSQAISTLHAALENFSDNEDALALYKSLTGKPFQPGEKLNGNN